MYLLFRKGKNLTLRPRTSPMKLMSIGFKNLICATGKLRDSTLESMHRISEITYTTIQIIFAYIFVICGMTGYKSS